MSSSDNHRVFFVVQRHRSLLPKNGTSLSKFSTHFSSPATILVHLFVASLQKSVEKIGDAWNHYNSSIITDIVRQLDAWEPYNKNKRLGAALAIPDEVDEYLNRIVTGDETWLATSKASPILWWQTSVAQVYKNS